MVPPPATDAPRELTVREFAVLERVSERTVRTWVQKGAVEYRRTPGGGIRILDRRHLERRARPLDRVRSVDDP